MRREPLAFDVWFVARASGQPAAVPRRRLGLSTACPVQPPGTTGCAASGKSDGSKTYDNQVDPHHDPEDPEDGYRSRGVSDRACLAFINPGVR